MTSRNLSPKDLEYVRKHKITVKEAEEIVIPKLADWYREHKRLKGKLDLGQYCCVVCNFIYLTFDTFTGGPTDKNRDVAFQEFSCWLTTNYPAENAMKIFKSVDNVTAYT